MSQCNIEVLCVVYEGKYQCMVVCGIWEYSECIYVGGLVVIIIVVILEDKVLFVEQFCVLLQVFIIEMLVGLVGDIYVGELIEVLVVCELEEEIGWIVDYVEVLMIGLIFFGVSSEKIVFVCVIGLCCIGEGGGDDSEDIIVYEILCNEVVVWLVQKMGEGYELDVKFWVGLWMIEYYLDGCLCG